MSKDSATVLALVLAVILCSALEPFGLVRLLSRLLLQALGVI